MSSVEEKLADRTGDLRRQLEKLPDSQADINGPAQDVEKLNVEFIEALAKGEIQNPQAMAELVRTVNEAADAAYA